MKYVRSQLILFAIAFSALPLLGGQQHDEKAPSSSSSVGHWKLLFSNADDVTDTWGKLHFGVTPLRLMGEREDPGFKIVSCFPLANGSWQVFGQELSKVKRGKGDEQTVTWKLIRATTTDGRRFQNVETVFESQPALWTSHIALARSGDSGEYLMLKLKIDNSGFAYTAFLSSDGRQWQEYSNNPLFYDGDSMSLFWSPAAGRFVCINKSLQPHRKHLLDHGGKTPALGDDSLRDRRVLMIRSSRDGRRWEPSVSMHDVWNRNAQKGAIPARLLTTPDAHDPPDLEFYSGNGFWYYDRAYMTVLNYAASPLTPRKHGPHLDNEWWTSRDGLRWDRPARDVNSLEGFPNVERLETNPLVIGGNILFSHGKQLVGLPEDRISFVGARANGEFSTRSFTMPAEDLFLNAAAPAPDRTFAKDQAYVMTAVLDENGSVIPGFEAESCILQNEDRTDIPLKWGDASARQLAGKKIRLRFYLRSANVYAVTSGGPR